MAALEAEQREVERQSRECYFQRKTYEQIITRLKEEATTYTPEMEQLDVMQAAKEGDSKQLMLMVKDANAVRDVAREELRMGALSEAEYSVTCSSCSTLACDPP